MSLFWTEYRMARSGKLAPFFSAAFTALWQVSFRSCGAGCHSGGPCMQALLRIGLGIIMKAWYQNLYASLVKGRGLRGQIDASHDRLLCMGCLCSCARETALDGTAAQPPAGFKAWINLYVRSSGESQADIQSSCVSVQRLMIWAEHSLPC